MSTRILPARRTAQADAAAATGSPAPVWARWPVLVASAVLGIVIIGWSYRLSAQGASSAVYYLVFWAGLLRGALPAAGAMIARSSSPARRVWALGLLAVLTAVPKYLRNPDAPLYHDEYAHCRRRPVIGAPRRAEHDHPDRPVLPGHLGTDRGGAAADRPVRLAGR